MFFNVTNNAFHTIHTTHALLMQEMIVVVLDMDETLGVFEEDTFHVRPHVDFMIQMLRCMDVDIVLWSLGDDPYVHRIVNSFLPSITLYAYKIFARSEAKIAHQLYGYSKAGTHIRQMYEEDIFLMGVDDQVHTNMDSSYDVRIYAKPYRQPDKTDQILLHICEKIVENISLVKDLSPDKTN